MRGFCKRIGASSLWGPLSSAGTRCGLCLVPLCYFQGDECGTIRNSGREARVGTGAPLRQHFPGVSTKWHEGPACAVSQIRATPSPATQPRPGSRPPRSLSQLHPVRCNHPSLPGGPSPSNLAGTCPPAQLASWTSTQQDRAGGNARGGPRSEARREGPAAARSLSPHLITGEGLGFLCGGGGERFQTQWVRKGWNFASASLSTQFREC